MILYQYLNIDGLRDNCRDCSRTCINVDDCCHPGITKSEMDIILRDVARIFGLGRRLISVEVWAKKMWSEKQFFACSGLFRLVKYNIKYKHKRKMANEHHFVLGAIFLFGGLKPPPSPCLATYLIIVLRNTSYYW